MHQWLVQQLVESGLLAAPQLATLASSDGSAGCWVALHAQEESLEPLRSPFHDALWCHRQRVPELEASHLPLPGAEARRGAQAAAAHVCRGPGAQHQSRLHRELTHRYSPLTRRLLLLTLLERFSTSLACTLRPELRRACGPATLCMYPGELRRVRGPAADRGEHRWRDRAGLTAGCTHSSKLSTGSRSTQVGSVFNTHKHR